MPKMKKEHYYLTFILLIIFCVFQYGIQKICGFTMYPDEFGYWASAANVVGYDWSEVASMGSYYSFGYSIVLIPILKFFSDGAMAYRVAIFINMLLMCACVFLFQEIIKKAFPKVEKSRSIFVCGIAVLYPAWIFYMQMTMAEGLLFFLFVLIIYLFIEFVESRKSSTAIILGISLIYIYCVHMRTIGVLLAGVLSCTLWGIAGKGRKKKLLILFGTVILASALAFLLKNHTITKVFSYATESELSGNDYGSQWDKIADILTLSGCVQLLKEIVGKLFYLGFASFGLFYWAMRWCIREGICLIRKISKGKKEDIQVQQWMSIFLLMATIGQILISSIYMHRSGTIDCLIYGRYNEFLVPVTMLVGILELSENRFQLPVTLLQGTILGGMIGMFLNMIEKEKMSGIRGYHIAGISYMLKEDKINIPVFFRDTWLLGFGMMALVCIFVLLSSKWKNGWWLLSGVILMEIFAGLQISEHYTYQANESNYENQAIADFLKEQSKGEEQILFLDEGKPEFVDFLQMQMPEKSICVVTEEILERKEVPGEFLIAASETSQDDVLQKLYTKKLSTNTFWLYYN